MKILHICQYYHPGLGYQENLLPYYQSKLGNEVIVVTSDRILPVMRNVKAASIINYKPGEYEDNSVRIVRLKTTREFKNRFVFFKGLYEFLEVENPDYIFHHGLTSPSMYTVYKYKKAHRSSFLTIDNHSDLMISARNWLWKKVYYEFFWKSWLKKLQRYIDIAFGVTPLRCYFMNDILGIQNEKIRFLPIGADIDLASRVTINEKERILKEIDIPKDSFIFITGGKITKYKRYDVLINAFKKLRKLYKNVYLIIFGNIRDPDLEMEISKERNIRFIGWLDRYKTILFLKISDVAVWPYIHTTLMEDAIAAEVPMILRYYGSTCHHIVGNGVYFYSGDEFELFRVLKFIYENKDWLIPKMKEAAREQAKRLSYEKVAKESIEYYFDLSPKFLHEFYMREEICNLSFKYFERID